MSLSKLPIRSLTNCECNLLYRYWNGKRRFLLEILFIINFFERRLPTGRVLRFLPFSCKLLSPLLLSFERRERDRILVNLFALYGDSGEQSYISMEKSFWLFLFLNLSFNTKINLGFMNFKRRMDDAISGIQPNI